MTLPIVAEKGTEILSSVPQNAATFMVGTLDSKGKGALKLVACYAGFNYGGDRCDLQAIAVLNHKMPGGDFPDRDEAYLAYTKWITSPVISPWKSVLPKEYNNLFWNPEFVANHGYLMTDMDQPGNGLFNFLIAARYPMEFTGAFWLWWQMVKDGIHPSLAFWISHVFGHMTNVEYFQRPFPYSGVSYGHHAIYASSWDESVIKDFIAGNMTNKFKKGYREYPTFIPCNKVWTPKMTFKIGYGAYIMKEYKDVDIYARLPFGVRPPTPLWTAEEVIKLAHKEQVRLGIVSNTEANPENIKVSEGHESLRSPTGG